VTGPAGDSRPNDLEIAERLARDVAESSSGLTWRKVTTLLDLFGVYRLTQDVRERIGGAICAVGLEAKPPIAEVQRYETVRLALPAEESSNGSTGRSRTMSRLLPLDDALRVTLWRPDSPPEECSLFAIDPGAIAWIDVDVIHTEPDLVFEALAPVCPGLTQQMVDDLFTVDPRPHVHAYDDTPDVRFVSAFSVHADESEQGAADADASKAGALVFQLVEMLAGEGWVITCWHRSKRYEGAEEIAEGAPEGHQAAYRGVERWWNHGGVATAGDLATLVLHELVLTYPSAARVMLSWLEQWELDFHRRFDRTERHTLIDVRSLLAELEERLAAIERPEEDPVEAWFTGLSSDRWARRVHDLVERALSDARAIHGTHRAALDLLGVHSAAQHLHLAEEQAARSRRLQGALAVVTAVLLVPTLIAGLFGSNTQVPGQGQWWGFYLMLGLMVGGAAITYRLTRGRGDD
jgi:hypothetical protein